MALNLIAPVKIQEEINARKRLIHLAENDRVVDRINYEVVLLEQHLALNKKIHEDKIEKLLFDLCEKDRNTLMKKVFLQFRDWEKRCTVRDSDKNPYYKLFEETPVFDQEQRELSFNTE